MPYRDQPRFQYIEKRFQRTLVGGFALVILLMLGSGLLGLLAMRSIEQGAERLSDRLLLQTRLIDRLQRHQANLGLALFSMAKENLGHWPRGLRKEIETLEEQILQDTREARQQEFPEDEHLAWLHVEQSAGPLFLEIHRLLALSQNNSPELSTLHRQFIASIARLMEISYDDVASIRAEELSKDARRIQFAGILHALAIGLAVLCGGACVVYSVRLFLALEKHAESLGRLSLHILSEQEDAARRFSQDMHDEFGQTLNAIEANLTVLQAGDADSRERLDDARALAKEAVVMAREMSQLLRPRILDDFGLDAGLRELAQGFSQRTGIVVDYRSNMRQRIMPEIETHLFRIAQEALTNVSRHSSATRVDLELRSEGDLVTLRIADNGGGFRNEKASKGLGLLGMHERARAAGGHVAIRSDPDNGVEVEVVIRLRRPAPPTPLAHPLAEQSIHGGRKEKDGVWSLGKNV